MLIEIKNAKKFDHGLRTRWFSDDYFDLTIWLNDSEEIVSFQLTYDKYHNPHALSWKSGNGYRHEKVDDGEISGRYKKSPILLADGHFSKNIIADRFKSEGAEISPEITDFIYGKILSY